MPLEIPIKVKLDEASMNALKARMERFKAPAWMGAQMAQKFTDPEEVALRLQAAQQLRQKRLQLRQEKATEQAEANFRQRMVEQSKKGEQWWNQYAKGKAPAAPPDPLIAKTQKTLQDQLRERFLPPRLSRVKPPSLPHSLPPPPLAGLTGVPYVGAVARAIMNPWTAAVAAAVAAMALFRKAINATMQAIEDARRLYARQLQSGGLPGGFVAMRGALARTIGVGEGEVLQYGRAVEYLSGRLAHATAIQSKVSARLASTSWEFKVLEENIGALFSTIANNAAPALRAFAAGLSEVVKVATNFMQSPAGRAAQAAAATSAALASGGVAQIIAKLIGAGAKTNPQDAPPVEAWSKRMPTSPWERMGLVLGVASGRNPAQETARNTKRTAELLDKILGGMSRRGGEMNLPVMQEP